MKIALDPGHGGENQGWYSGEEKRRFTTDESGEPIHETWKEADGRLVEKDYCLDMCRALRPLIVLELGHEVILTREGDATMGQRARGEITRVWDADLVLSIHVNAHAAETIRGLITFYWPSSALGHDVATAIAEAAPETVKRTRNHVFATGEDRWLKDARAICGAHAAPTVLIELFHGTNPTDLEYGLSDEGKTELAQAIKVGIEAGLTRHGANA